MESLAANGESVNLNVNSGNPVGISAMPSSYSKDDRTTSAIAPLMEPPENLTIWTGATIHKLLFEGTKVVGIEATDGGTGKWLSIWCSKHC